MRRKAKTMPSASEDLFYMFILAIPVANVSWTVTHEEIFREAREWCKGKSETCQHLAKRKLFYLFTCEYCFSFYVTAVLLAITRFRLLYPDWRGYVISLFTLVWIANVYMSLFGRIRLDIKRERVAIEKEEDEGGTPL
jgi:hypothetical protein